MTLHNERRTVVPWFSMAEWDMTYKNIYSGSTEMQFLAYEKMLVWKARCQRLPLAVECTMGMLQVLIKDKQLVVEIGDGFMHPYQEYDLRLQYSTSVMRFLNQIVVLTKSSSDTLYQAARKMYVPDWLVGLRHDIAHGATLPPLALLRKAAQFALTWLHEYYWKGEATASSDFVAAEGDLGTSEDSEELKELLEMWQALKLYSLAEYKHLGQIPDGPLRKFLRQIRQTKKRSTTKAAGTREASNETRTFLPDISKKQQPQDAVNEDELVPLRNAAASLEEKVLTHIKRNKCSPVLCDQVVDYLLSGQVFIPPAAIWNMFAENNRDGTNLAPWLIEIWSPMLNLLQQNLNFLPALLCRLASATVDSQLEQHQQRVAALWMKELFAACVKSQLILKVLYLEFSLSCGTNVPKELWSKAEKLVVKKQPHFDRVISLRTSELPDPVLSVGDVKDILLSPGRWTHLFLSEMLEAVRLPQRLSESLISLVNIYTQELNVYDVDPEEDTDDEQVHTVSDLVECIPEEATEEITNSASNKVVEEGSTDDTSATWRRSHRKFDWTTCPLGILPWQKGNDLLRLDFDTDVSWKSSKLSESGEPKCYNEHELPSQIDWNKILKKRIRKGRVTKRKKKINNVLKNAFKMVYSAT